MTGGNGRSHQETSPTEVSCHRRHPGAGYLVRLSRMVGRVPVLADLLFWYYCYVRTSVQPPQFFNYVGFPDFASIGSGYFNNIRRLGGVTPNQHVLDVGCGIGRVAVHFTSFLNAGARYEGFDVVAKGPRWCNRKIGKQFPNFAFQHVNVYNRHYNKQGVVPAHEFTFPYEDETFDFVFATSVFTHLLPEAVARYLSEMGRVLKPGGRCFISYFVLNDTSKQHMSRSDFNFSCIDGRYGVMTEDDPEAAIAYEESYIKKLHQHSGLPLMLPIHYGDWSGRVGDVGGQDVILAQKPSRS